MNAQELVGTARTLVAGDKGLLAMDESNPTCNKRFAKLGISQTEEARCAYREYSIAANSSGEGYTPHRYGTTHDVSSKRIGRRT